MNFRSYLFILRCLSFSKIINLCKLYASYRLSILLKKNIHSGCPAFLSLEPTNHCNLKCPQCPSGTDTMNRPRGLMSMDTFYKCIKELKKSVIFVNLYFQGEPFINNEFYNMVSFANRHRIYTSTSTNLHCLTPGNATRTVNCGLKRVIVSIDGFNQETYASYRKNGSFAKAMEGLRNLKQAKEAVKSPYPYIVAQCLILKTTELHLKKIEKMLYNAGADKVEFKTAQFYDFKKGNELMPTVGKGRYMLGEHNEFEIKSKLPNKCWRMWNSAVVTWNGGIVPCCYDKSGTFKMGNINNSSFVDIWNADLYNSFRLSILESRKKIDICKNCTEGLRK